MPQRATGAPAEHMASEPVTTKPASLASQVSRAVVWNTLFVPLRMLAEVIATLVKLNLLSPASYGLLALISGASAGLGTAVDLGTARALPKYIPETYKAGGPRATLRLLLNVLGLQLAAFLVISTGLLLSSAGFLGSLRTRILEDARLDIAARGDLLQFVQDYAWLIFAAILLALFLSGICYDILMAYLNSFFKQRAWNSIALATGLLPPLLSAGAILAGWGLQGVLVAMILSPAIAVALAIWQVGRFWTETFQRSNVPTFQRSLLPRGFVRYSGVSYLMTMTDYLASAQFAVFLAADVGDAAVLAAGAALVRMILAYLYTPMVGVQVPLFTRVRAGEGGTLLGAYQSLIRLQVLLMVPGGIGLMILAHTALLVISPNYTAAAAIVWILVPCLFLESLLTTAHNALIVHEHLRIIVLSRLLTILVFVALALTLRATFGIVGVALAFGLARLTSGFWVTANGFRLLGLRWPWRFTLRVLLASGVMALLLLGLNSLVLQLPDAISLAARLQLAAWSLGVAAVGGMSFLGVLRLTGGLDPRDRQQLQQMRLPLKRWWLKVL